MAHYRTHIAFVSGTIVSALAAPSLAASIQPEPAAKPVTILSFEHAGLGAMLVDKKDQKLKEAFEMLPARLKELPGEFPEMRDFPMPVAELLMTALSRPGRLALTFDPNGQERGAMGFGLIAGISARDQAGASEMHGRISALMHDAPFAGDVKPSAEFKGMSELAAPFGGVIRYGPRQHDKVWNYELHVGALASPDDAFASLAAAKVPSAKGFTPWMSARMDFAALNDVAKTFMPLIENAGPEAETAMGELEKMGILGDHAMKMMWRSGYTADAQIGYTVIEGLKPHAAQMGVSTTPLTDAHFAMIPADATVAFVSSYDVHNTIGMLKTQIMADPEVAEQLEQFEGATGVNLFDDVLLSLGGTTGVYMSDTTGGSMLSAVVFTSLRDRATFEEAHTKLVGFANSMLASNHDVNGHVRIRAWKDGDLNMHSIIFPGIPVPVEVTYGIVGDWVVGGLTPQAAVAAARQIAGKGGEGLRANKGFSEYVSADKKVTSFSFIDTPRLMRDGYQYVSLVGSAIANMTRSATNDAREPGMIVPTYAELRQGAKPIVSFTYWKGDDQVTESIADRSMLVNASGIAGAAAPFIPVIGAMIAAAGPRAMDEMEQMEDAMDQLDQLLVPMP